MMGYPKLRPIEALPVALGGRDVIRLRGSTPLTNDAGSAPFTLEDDETSMLLSTMPTTAGTVLKYDQAVEPATQSMISYASVVFH
jgi:hypothetical protein